MNIYAVIMAGGVGSRFWPRSRKENPKQLLKIFGENTMIQDTVARLNGLVKNENIFIITNKIQALRVRNQLPQLPSENIIDEPFGKNTAPCIGLASVIIKQKDPDAVTVVLPADHLIFDVEKFKKRIEQAADYAYESGGLMTIGIIPDRPETGYGYIQFESEEVKPGIHKVSTFAEKPNLATAKRFLASGDFLWNSGMFIWKVSAILNEIKKYMPDLFEALNEIEEAFGKDDFDKTLTRIYGQLAKISIDYGIMEHSRNVFLIKGDFGWSDVGSWETVYQLSEKDEDGNAKFGDIYCEKTKNSYIYSLNKFSAVVGLENVIVINTPDALLVCNRENAQDVKSVVDYLNMKRKYELT
jgi:mannose-1-phosphate guanylyltransferase